MEALRDYAEWHSPDETGGVLFGYWRADGANVVVTGAIGPGAAARGSRHRFEPDYGFHERELARVYEGSGRMIEYLGDWHSHPGGQVGLSALDVRTLTAIARYAPARAPRALMAVLAGWSFDAIGVWMHDPARKGWFFGSRIQRLEVLRFGD